MGTSLKVALDISWLGLRYQNPMQGISRFVLALAHGLADSKECSLVLTAAHSMRLADQAWEYLQTDSKLKTHEFLTSDFKRRIYHTVKNYRFKMDNMPRPHGGMRITRKALKYIQSGLENIFHPLSAQDLLGVNVFHSPFYPLPPVVKPSLRRFLTIYDMIPVLYPQFCSNRAEMELREMLKSLSPKDCVICISESTKNDFCNYMKAFDPRQVFVIPLAASNSFWPCLNSDVLVNVRAKYKIPETPYFLSLSRLEPRKNIDHIIRSFVKLLREQKMNPLNLVLCGYPRLDQTAIRKAFEEAGELRNRIIFTGYVAEEDLAAIYSGALGFICVSLYEGFGLPALEAMRCGVPVISSNTSSLPEVVGDCGILIDPKDEDMLCQAMNDLYKKSSLREDMAAKSLQRAKLFSWEKCVQQTLTAYKTVAAQG